MKRINILNNRCLTPICSTRISTATNIFRSARIMRTKPVIQKIIDKFPIDKPENDQFVNDQPINDQSVNDRSGNDKYHELLNNYSEIKKKYNNLIQDENSYDKLVRFFNEEVKVSSGFVGTIMITSVVGWFFALLFIKVSNSK
ncbi:hypothetical protein [Powai lake megavirus]|uniref:Uncharacterized protein n=1 Tax=Powai lake megavirus TaxID=1842663 RepID=A0A160EPU2_9VIRU|nr:hypothetical protein QJ849_gp860 [Powai lake megavirus]ANB51022.1 hypothetical protein [Powai lake megavirus]